MKVTEGKPEVFHSPAWWDVAEIYANGSLMSNASDMVKYLQVWSGEGQIKGQSLISAASWETLTRSHIEMPSGQFYGYGVHITPSYHGVTVVEHGGAIKGVSSQIMVCPTVAAVATTTAIIRIWDAMAPIIVSQRAVRTCVIASRLSITAPC